jgi:serine/threonine protein phosphatase PrpC
MRLRVGAATDVGRVRELNEDVYVLQAETGLFVVCDGMGGAPAGEVASQIGVNAILRHVAAPADTVSTARPADVQSYLPHTQRLADAVRRSNRVIYDQAQRTPGQADMGTTVVAAWLRDHVASVAHVGDSRAYLWHDERLEPLTRDHSLVEAQLRAGLLQREEAATSPEQNVLVRVLGREPSVDVELKEVPVQPGDYLLLCSDGLTRMVSEEALAETFANVTHPQRICDRLVAAANGNGGADNITVVVVEVMERWWRRLVNRRRREDAGAPHGEAHSEV